ncbi:MAG: prepilin-type N-terminal cleavage/methylation domain-containing protein [Symploca sp. SIO1C2]|nr:prepilin-type N-terminal cleavage/methylation domain-containing protein [Symploca sp. SIO1C2]NER48714.1 prepilin-type N-terminal cleavage/methylation domain-containing protein [Symploca sp. SIO1A3]
MGILKLLLIAQRSSKQPSQVAGFTLIELLVGLIIAALVITPLLGFMINILQTDRREQAKANSEQELQIAAEYITRDLDQAVYIYDADGVDAIKGELLDVADGEPILVFWKRKFVPDSVPIPSGTNGTTCNNPNNCNDGFVFSLVTYYLIADNCVANNWSGCARVGRFELQDCVRDVDGGNCITGLGRADMTPGFQFDLRTLPGQTLTQRLNNWTSGTFDANASPNILLDYIDHTTAAVPAAPACPNDPRWQLVPDTDAANGFYACVDSTSNQTAQVFLRGNALGRLNPKDKIPVYDDKISTFFPSAQLQATGSGRLSINN